MKPTKQIFLEFPTDGLLDTQAPLLAMIEKHLCTIMVENNDCEGGNFIN